jgi:hypothetical protein
LCTFATCCPAAAASDAEDDGVLEEEAAHLTVTDTAAERTHGRLGVEGRAGVTREEEVTR